MLRSLSSSSFVTIFVFGVIACIIFQFPPLSEAFLLQFLPYPKTSPSIRCSSACCIVLFNQKQQRSYSNNNKHNNEYVINNKNKIQWFSSGVSLQNVSHSYYYGSGAKDNNLLWWRTLTSSVPRRVYSIENLTVELYSEFRLIIGASSSGKSTFLQLILGGEGQEGTTTTTTTTAKTGIQPDSGHVQLFSSLDDDNYTRETMTTSATTATTNKELQVSSSISSSSSSSSCPIILTEKPNIYDKPKNQHIHSILKDYIQSNLPSPPSPYNNNNSGDNDTMVNERISDILLEEMKTIFEIPFEKTLIELSSSECYRYSLAIACLESIIGSIQINKKRSTAKEEEEEDHYNDNDNDDVMVLQLSAPILLLDEWMDTETSMVVRNVQPSLERLVQRGALILSVTHKPQLYQSISSSIGGDGCTGDEAQQQFKKPLTFCRGTILSSY